MIEIGYIVRGYIESDLDLKSYRIFIVIVVQGSWSPSININTLLLTIRVLMANPNANDGLVASIVSRATHVVYTYMHVWQMTNFSFIFVSIGIGAFVD